MDHCDEGRQVWIPHVERAGRGMDPGVFLLLSSGCAAPEPQVQCDSDISSLLSCAQTVRRARQRGQLMVQGQPGSASLPSLDKVAPSRKSCEEKVVQVKTGPSLCLAQTGWKATLWIW